METVTGEKEEELTRMYHSGQDPTAIVLKEETPCALPYESGEGGGHERGRRIL